MKQINFLISNQEDELEIIGTHFNNTHTKYLHTGRERLNEIINKAITNLEK